MRRGVAYPGQGITLMRRLALTALLGAIAVSACTDEARQSPTEPPAIPQQNLASCRPVKFPLVPATSLIKQVFPPNRLRVEALAGVTAIAVLWDACKVNLARRGVASFINWMNRNSQRLTGTRTQQNQLIALLFTGVGLPAPSDTPLGPDFGIGTVDPAATTATTIETQGNTGLIEFEPAAPGQPAAFPELTVVSITRRPDAFRLDGFPEEDQFPPFFDYNASNASNTHRIAAGAVARMAFCLLGSTAFPDGYPDGSRIGHNPDPSLGPPAFEIIPTDPNVAGFAGDLVCNNLQTTGGSLGGALGFGRTAGRFFGPLVRTLFLPKPLMAMTVGTRGPLGGLPPSLTPFGVVNATSYFGYEDGEPAWINNGFWNRRNSTPLLNSAFPTYVSTFDLPGVAGGTVPPPFRKARSGWYGQLSTGNYIGTQLSGDFAGSGGTSTAANSGMFVSPGLQVPDVAARIELRFKTWWEIEGVNPSTFDIMSVEISDGESSIVKYLNPTTDPETPEGGQPEDRRAQPYTSGGFNTAPVWQSVAYDISRFRGETVHVTFAFNTRDQRYNGFRGWLVDDVRISTGTSTAIGVQLNAPLGADNQVLPADQLPSISR